VQFLASIHADHTTKRHIHILALVDRRLTKGDLTALRTAATEAARSQREERDVAQQPTPARHIRQPAVRTTGTGRGEGPLSPAGRLPSCPNCGPGSRMEPHGRFYECPNCGLAVRRSMGLRLEVKAGTGLELSLGEGGRHD
jgi:hypothetical protein